MSDVRNEMEDRKGTAGQGTMAEQPAAGVAGAEEEEGAGPSGAITDHWTIAAVTHASILLTLVFSFAGGVGAFIGLVIPLMVYLSYRERSRFLAFHALQALVYQGAGVLLYLVLVIVSALVATVAWIISGLLSVVAIGFLLMPLALLFTIAMVIILLGAPLAWVAYGLYAAYQVYQGTNFRYWLVGEWVEREVAI